MATIMLPQEENPLNRFLQMYMQQQQQRRSLEQNQRQFDTTMAAEAPEREARIGRDKSATSLQDSSRELDVAKTGAEGAIKAIAEYWAVGDVEGAARYAQEQIAANPQLGPALVGYAKARLRTLNDESRANTAKFSADQTGMAASGSPDAQARNFTFQLATGEQMQAPVFADQQQRQGPPRSYEEFLARKGGAKPTAAEDPQAATQLQISREGNASNERIAADRVGAVSTKPSSAIEKRTLSFYLRAKDAVEQLEEVDQQTGKPLHEAVGNKGIVGQTWLNNAPNFAQPEENQLYTQAQRQFTEARLRKDSGAAIPEFEFENDRRTYFAQPGDVPVVIERKKKARENLLNSLKMESGRAYGEHFGIEDQGDDPLGILK